MVNAGMSEYAAGGGDRRGDQELLPLAYRQRRRVVTTGRSPFSITQLLTTWRLACALIPVPIPATPQRPSMHLSRKGFDERGVEVFGGRVPPGTQRGDDGGVVDDDRGAPVGGERLGQPVITTVSGARIGAHHDAHIGRGLVEHFGIGYRAHVGGVGRVALQGRRCSGNPSPPGSPRRPTPTMSR